MEDEYAALRLDNQLCFPLYAAARKVMSLYTPYLSPLGLTYTQYIMLLALWEKDDVPVGELGVKLHLDTGTLTPVLKRLETDGHIVRSRSQADERVVIVRLTGKGRALREAVKDLPQKIAACVPLAPDDAKMLYRLLYLVLGSDAPATSKKRDD